MRFNDHADAGADVHCEFSGVIVHPDDKARWALQISGKQPPATSAVPRPALTPGTRLIREWNGKTITVDVLENGFLHEAKVYRSLSEIARRLPGRTGRDHGFPASASVADKVLRGAVYTRRSTEDGLKQEFNSLDAQYEACCAYAASQRHEGWVLVPERYDAGGFSGGNMQGQGLQRLLADVAAGKVDIILVYKIVGCSG